MKGFSVYPRQDSPHYYATIPDASTVKGWRSLRTPYRKDDAAGKRKALTWASERSGIAREDRRSAGHERWIVWVPAFLQSAFGYNPKTLQRYKNAWAPLLEFLTTQGVQTPRQLERRHGREYMAWRTAQRRKCGTTINHNTALTELRVLSRIMREAHDREYTSSNPLYRLGLGRVNVKEKPEMTDEDIEKHFAALPRYPEWMTTCFEIALYHGVRLTETQVPMDLVHLDPRTRWVDGEYENHDEIRFVMKGEHGQAKVHIVPLHPALRPKMEHLKAAGAKFTCELPPAAAKLWWKFRRDNGLSHVVFHSTRVTVGTRMFREGATENQTMAYLNHSSALVNRIYIRRRARDAAPVAQRALRYPTSNARSGTPGAAAPSLPEALSS